jgi:hypothetical protein
MVTSGIYFSAIYTRDGSVPGGGVGENIWYKNKIEFLFFHLFLLVPRWREGGPQRRPHELGPPTVPVYQYILHPTPFKNSHSTSQFCLYSMSSYCILLPCTFHPWTLQPRMFVYLILRNMYEAFHRQYFQGHQIQEI